MKMSKTYDVLVEGIDVQLLKKQKEAVFNCMSRSTDDNEADMLDGVLCIISFIQDKLVDEQGLTEEEVFK